MPNLDAARRAREILRAAGVKIVPISPIAKASRNPRSLRAAIDGKCWDCIGAGADPNPRGAIRDCRITSCTLHPVRPYQASYLRGKRYNGEKKAVGEHAGNQYTEKYQNDPIPTADRLAAEYKVSAPTIKRDGQYAAAVDKLAEAGIEPQGPPASH